MITKNFKFVSLLLVLLTLTMHDNAKACSCVDHPPFFEVAEFVDFVAFIEVSEFQTFVDHRTWEYVTVNEEFDRSHQMVIPVSMTVKVKSRLLGDEDRTEILIWGDNGVMCRPYLDKFKPGSKWIVALKKGDREWGHPDEKSLDYYIHGCGEYHLEITDNKVSGAISQKYELVPKEDYIELVGQEMSLNEFLLSFQKMPYK